jgi:hypothetical protein
MAYAVLGGRGGLSFLAFRQARERVFSPFASASATGRTRYVANDFAMNLEPRTEAGAWHEARHAGSRQCGIGKSSARLDLVVYGSLSFSRKRYCR